MNSIRYIRIVIFRVNQTAFAKIAGVQQPTVSRWERDLLQPDRAHLQQIRSEAKRRKLELPDNLFFEAAA